MRTTFLASALFYACSMPVLAQTGTAEQVFALDDATVAELQANMSESRQVLTQRGGAQLYQATCQGCHMPQGQGSTGAGFYPPLAANEKLVAASYPISIVMNGLHGMPGFAARMSNEQVAEVVNYIRTHFGNNYPDAVQAEDVQVFR